MALLYPNEKIVRTWFRLADYTSGAAIVPLLTWKGLAMRSLGYLAFALVVAMGAGAPAYAANTCQADNLTCATTMPVGGYCECTARGATHSGTVVSQPNRGRTDNSTAGGCGAHPNAPGCR